MTVSHTFLESCPDTQTILQIYVFSCLAQNYSPHAKRKMHILFSEDMLAVDELPLNDRHKQMHAGDDMH